MNVKPPIAINWFALMYRKIMIMTYVLTALIQIQISIKEPIIRSNVRT